jgi:hypothetical protein
MKEHMMKSAQVNMSDEFPIQNCVKRGKASLPLLLNFVLEYADGTRLPDHSLCVSYWFAAPATPLQSSPLSTPFSPIPATSP